ncbi:MAG: hypothetical protein R3324_01340 [Halobacteriales archaeon]|nr:hypothetical protein [Halobacteriales archaeon]
MEEGPPEARDEAASVDRWRRVAVAGARVGLSTGLVGVLLVVVSLWLSIALGQGAYPRFIFGVGILIAGIGLVLLGASLAAFVGLRILREFDQRSGD